MKVHSTITMGTDFDIHLQVLIGKYWVTIIQFYARGLLIAYKEYATKDNNKYSFGYGMDCCNLEMVPNTNRDDTLQLPKSLVLGDDIGAKLLKQGDTLIETSLNIVTKQNNTRYFPKAQFAKYIDCLQTKVDDIENGRLRYIHKQSDDWGRRNVEPWRPVVDKWFDVITTSLPSYSMNDHGDGIWNLSDDKESINAATNEIIKNQKKMVTERYNLLKNVSDKYMLKEFPDDIIQIVNLYSIPVAADVRIGIKMNA